MKNQAYLLSLKSSSCDTVGSRAFSTFAPSSEASGLCQWLSKVRRLGDGIDADNVSRSSVAVKLTPRSTLATSQPGAAYTQKSEFSSIYATQVLATICSLERAISLSTVINLAFQAYEWTADACTLDRGIRGVFYGWSPTFVGYSFQGAGKYGFYEIFKNLYGEKLFPNANKTIVYLGASASAEFLADLALCPFEAIKVRMQTSLPPFAKNMREGWGKIVSKEGYSGLYKGLQPLWGRQIPYTMVKFATFETTVNYIYATLGKPKETYNSLQQTGVSFLGGYIAGVGCAVISHPADVMVSKLNADRQRE